MTDHGSIPAASGACSPASAQDSRLIERFLCLLAMETMRSQIYEQQMIVRSTRYDIKALFNQCIC